MVLRLKKRKDVQPTKDMPMRITTVLPAIVCRTIGGSSGLRLCKGARVINTDENDKMVATKKEIRYLLGCDWWGS